MTGKSEKLVSRESAIQSSSRNPQDIFAINQNHSNMVKFPPGDAVYLAVRNHLEQIANQRENVNTVEKKPDSIPSAGEFGIERMTTTHLLQGHHIQHPTLMEYTTTPYLLINSVSVLNSRHRRNRLISDLLCSRLEARKRTN